jgi:3-methylcrotonyl-CoA carboxylase alpha subunit
MTLKDHQEAEEAALTPWSSLAFRRFGGDISERRINLQGQDASAKPVTVKVKCHTPGSFDVTVESDSGPTTTFHSVPAKLVSPTTLQTTLDGRQSRTTLVCQGPSQTTHVSTSPNTMARLHVFSGASRTTVLLSPPRWLLSLGKDVLKAVKGSLKAPMPSLVVDVRVQVGDKVKSGDSIVILESMKTETVLRAESDGIVRVVGCKKGEMVEEGRELVNIEAEQTTE